VFEVASRHFMPRLPAAEAGTSHAALAPPTRWLGFERKEGADVPQP
jgi:hypothetical protein